MENWSEEITKTIDDKLKDTRDKEIRFFRIDEFKRNIARIDKYSKNCPACQKKKITAQEIVNNIDSAINSPGKKRREYDRFIATLSKHMQKEHGFYPPYHFSYLYSFFGIVTGLFIGYIFMKIYPELWIETLSIGFAIGVIPGYVWGSLKDKKIRSEKRLM